MITFNIEIHVMSIVHKTLVKHESYEKWQGGDINFDKTGQSFFFLPAWFIEPVCENTTLEPSSTSLGPSPPPSICSTSTNIMWLDF